MISIVQFERVIETGLYGLDTLHLADSDLHYRIRGEDLVECGNVIAVEQVRIERSKVADLFAVQQLFEIDVHDQKPLSLMNGLRLPGHPNRQTVLLPL